MQELTVNLLVPQESQEKLNIQTVDLEDWPKNLPKKWFEQQQTPRHTQPPLEVLKSPSFALTDSTTSNTPTEVDPQIFDHFASTQVGQGCALLE